MSSPQATYSLTDESKPLFTTSEGTSATQVVGFGSLASNPPLVHPDYSSRSKDVDPSSLVVTRINLEKCIESCERCEDADDPALRCNAFAVLKTSHTHLWNIRHRQSNEFAQVINCIQMLIEGLDYDDFTITNMTTLRKGIQRMLEADGKIDGHLVRSIVGEFSAGGLDVFRELD